MHILHHMHLLQPRIGCARQRGQRCSEPRAHHESGHLPARGATTKFDACSRSLRRKRGSRYGYGYCHMIGRRAVPHRRSGHVAIVIVVC